MRSDPSSFDRARAEALKAGRQVLALAAVAIAAVVLLGWSLAAPPSRSAAHTTAYVGRVNLSYSASASPGSVYGKTGVETGEPLFLEALHGLQLTARYRLSGAPGTEANGSMKLVVSVVDQGLVESWAQSATVAVRGTAGTVSVLLPLDRYRQILNSFNSLGGPGSYAVVASPTVSVSATTGGVAVHSLLAPSFTFEGSSATLLPPIAQSSAPAGAGAGGSVAAALSHSTTGQVRQTFTTPTTWHVAGLALPLTVLRWFSLGLLLVVGALLVLASRRQQAAFRLDPRVATSLRLGTRLVRVSEPIAPVPEDVEIASLPELVRVARTLEAPVLVDHRKEESIFMVREGRFVYRHTMSGPAPMAETAAVEDAVAVAHEAVALSGAESPLLAPAQAAVVSPNGPRHGRSLAS